MADAMIGELTAAYETRAGHSAGQIGLLIIGDGNQHKRPSRNSTDGS